MPIVKNLAFCNKNKLKNLTPFIDSELDLSAFHPFPVDFVHHFIPFKLKFLDESFVVIKDGKIYGLITIQKTAGKRIKITRMFLEEDAFLYGKLLVDYVTTNFISKGAETFYVIADKKNTSIINMLINDCGFREGASEVVFKSEDSMPSDNNFSGFECVTNQDWVNIIAFQNSIMNSFHKPSFKKSLDDIKGIKFSNTEKYILRGKDKNIAAYFSLLKLNKFDYMLDFVVSPAYEAYLGDIINFARSKFLNKKNAKNLYIRIKNYYSNFFEIFKILNESYELKSENVILVKDFLVAQKQENPYTKMIFNDITPAF